MLSFLSHLRNVRLSGRQMKRGKNARPFTEPALLAGLSVLLPMLDLVEQAQCAIDELVDVMGRATIEAILQMSAEGLAGPKQQGKQTDRDEHRQSRNAEGLHRSEGTAAASRQAPTEAEKTAAG